MHVILLCCSSSYAGNLATDCSVVFSLASLISFIIFECLIEWVEFVGGMVAALALVQFVFSVVILVWAMASSASPLFAVDFV